MRPLAFVSYSGLWGGAERITLDLARALDEPVVLVCPEGELAARARRAGVPVLARPAQPRELRGGLRTRARAGLALGAHARETRTALAAVRPRAVVAFGMRSAIACAAALRTLPGRTPLVFEHVDFLPSAGVARAVRAAAGAADLVIALSRAVAEDLDPERRLGERLAVVAPGVDVAAFTPTPPPADPPVALLLGAIADWKRPDLALEAVAIAARRLPGLRLVVAGHTVGEASEQLLERLRGRAARGDLAGRVDFPGALADPRAALSAASCLLHCADREPFGLVLAEAMAAGRPVVAPAAGGPVEIVADGTGELYAPGDAEAAAAALVRVLEDPQRLRDSGERARAHAEREFGVEASARRWAAAAERVLRRGAPPDRDGRPGDGLTLVTVTHNSEAELDRLLASAERHLPGAPVVVVDSGSSDGGAELAARRGARVLELDNVGYGRAVERRAPVGGDAGDRGAQPRRRAGRRLAGRARRGGAAPRPARAAAGAAGTAPRRRAPGLRPRRAGVARRRRHRADPAGGAAAAGALRRPALARRARPARRLGRRLLRRRAHRDACAGWGPSTSASSCTRRTSSSACAPAT